MIPSARDATRRDRLGALFWLAFSLYTVIMSYRLGLGKVGMPGPGYFPFGASALLGVISLSILVRTFTAPARESVPPNGSSARLNWQGLLSTLGGMAGYVLLLPRMGFVTSTFLLMIFFLWVVGRQRWLSALAISLAITLAAYLLFNVLLDAQLPRGFWAF